MQALVWMGSTVLLKFLLSTILGASDDVSFVSSRWSPSHKCCYLAIVILNAIHLKNKFCLEIFFSATVICRVFFFFKDLWFFFSHLIMCRCFNSCCMFPYFCFQGSHQWPDQVQVYQLQGLPHAHVHVCCRVQLHGVGGKIEVGAYLMRRCHLFLSPPDSWTLPENAAAACHRVAGGFDSKDSKRLFFFFCDPNIKCTTWSFFCPFQIMQDVIRYLRDGAKAPEQNKDHKNEEAVRWDDVTVHLHDSSLGTAFQFCRNLETVNGENDN